MKVVRSRAAGTRTMGRGDSGAVAVEERCGRDLLMLPTSCSDDSVALEIRFGALCSSGIARPRAKSVIKPGSIDNDASASFGSRAPHPAAYRATTILR